jgi:hypothetical protein
MADNTTLNTGTGGDVIASDDIGGVKHQRVKVEYGADGSATDVSTATPLPVMLQNFASTVNSTAATLGIGGVFTGTSESVLGYGTVTVTVFADQVSATDGLSMQQSSNGTNWDNVDVYTIPASTGKTFKADINAAFYRTVYTNGGVAQTAFRLQTMYHQTGHMGSSIRPGDARSLQNDMREVVGYNAYYNGSTFDLARGTIANGALVDVSRGPTLTKNTQGSTGFSVQDLKDAGRNARHFILDTFTAAPVADALQSVAQWYSNAAVAATTTTPAVVPTGKTLRLTSFYLETKALATVGSVVVRVRVNTAGVAAIGSPIAFTFGTGTKAGATTVAMTGGSSEIFGSFPEGFEIPAASGVGFSLAGYGPTGTLTLQGVTRFAVYGYEY